MSQQKKIVQKFKVGSEFRQDNTGMVYTVMAPDDALDSDSVQDTSMFPPLRDPVLERSRKSRKRSRTPSPAERARTPDTLINPSISVRLDMEKPPDFPREDFQPLIKYPAPKPKGTKKLAKERHLKEQSERMVCEYGVLRLPSPTETFNLASSFVVPSPEMSTAKVMPRKPSVDPEALYPDLPTESQLKLHKPRSGVYINPKDEAESETESEISLDEKKGIQSEGMKEEPGVKEERLSTIPDEDEEDWEDMEDEWAEELYGEGEEPPFLDKSTAVDEETYFKTVRKKVSQISKATSLNEKDLPMYEDLSWDQIPAICKLVQTFRTEQEEEKPKKKIKKGTLESHSYTKVKQKAVEEFCYKSLLGTIHQGDDNFSLISRNRQGICMSIAAFCYAKLKKPKTWTEKSVDEVVEIGDKLYRDSLGTLHIHKLKKELTAKEVDKVLYINSKKVKYEILDPDVNGHIRSADKRIFNITKGLKIFFNRNKAGIFQASGINLVMWRCKKYYYFFDSNPRRKDLQQDPNGAAVLAIVQSVAALVAILLDRTDLENSAFIISRIQIVRVMGMDDKEEELVEEKSEYNILNDRKAVVQGTFDLGDKCFLFTRNKQALTMATACLAYSRITSPNSWHKKTIDKIMIIGNQLYMECAETEGVTELTLDNLPAIFTIGPYIIEIYIYANCCADMMFKKSQCSFRKTLEEFFEKNTNGIVEIGGKFVLAIWRQRNMFYCFDPYSRNSDGLKCRNGSACVSMNADLDTLVETVALNFDDRDAIFYIHALKVLKIHRDPAMNRMFPKTMTLNEVPVDHFKRTRLKKSKKKAVAKPIRTDFTDYAMKKLLAGDSPGASFIEIGSNIGSLNQAFLPPFLQKFPAKQLIKTRICEMTDVADLDSPSLSETQIDPERPSPIKTEEEIMFMDLDSYDLTQEELELQVACEEDYGEEEGEEGGGDFEEQEGEEEYYLSRAVYSQVDSISLESMHRNISEEINTDITYRYKILPAIELPAKSKKEPDLPLVIDEDAQKLELAKPSEYEKLPDKSQILRGSKNLTAYGDQVEDMIPYVCIMATAYAQEIPIYKWTKKNVNFVLKSGMELYYSFEEPYNQVEDFHLEFKKHTVCVTLEMALDTYVGQNLFETFAGQKALEALLENHIFSKSDCGFIITPEYCCAIFLKRNVLYLFDCYGSNKVGMIEGRETSGTACVLRFKELESLATRILHNRKQRVPEETDQEYTHFILATPDIVKSGEKKPKVTVYDEDGNRIEPELTQSQELALDHNFIDLPDNTQLLRGTTEIGHFDDDIDLVTPFVCVMAGAVARKYQVSTWSPDIVNYVLRCGSELHKKSKVQFEQVAKLEIPRVSLGSTDFSLEVNYLYDAPMKHNVLESSLKKLLRQFGDWAIIVTQGYACATYYRNHLYYLFDAYPTNEVGLSEGRHTKGFASFSRFKDLCALVTRIMYNKSKREKKELLEYSRFVLSTCTIKYLKPDAGPQQRRSKKTDTLLDDFLEQEGEADVGELLDEKDKKAGHVEAEPLNKVGFQDRGDGHMVIEGTTSLEGREVVAEELKEDHFVCLCACLMVINCPVAKWDTKKVDMVIGQGRHIYTHAENLEVSDKRTIKNILMYRHFFDIIVKPIRIMDWRKNKNLDVGLKTIMEKRKFCLVQFPNCCVVVYRDDANDVYYVFDPYSWSYKHNEDEIEEIQAGWILFPDFRRMKRKVKSSVVKEGQGNYTFYSFEVISVRKAPKKLLLAHKLEQYEMDKIPKPEIMGKPFHELESWLNIHQTPWSRMKEQTASGKTRGKRDSTWFYWDIEYNNDLYSLIGDLHQTSKTFAKENRGRQTIANLVVAIAMTNIYELCEWNASIMDSVLTNGDHYFTECVKDIEEDNYEMSLEDLLEKCSIFPYSFKVAYTPSIEGTMFLTHIRKFNLYKALRYFFENYESRSGIIISHKGQNRRLAAFGKIQENEYFMYDCQAMGPPMFYEHKGYSYILRCITLSRLLHCLVLTLKGGDFYIYDVETFEFEAIS